jgi:hypothetical protein
VGPVSPESVDPSLPPLTVPSLEFMVAVMAPDTEVTVVIVPLVDIVPLD